jgi:hypothetical protein
MKSLLVVLCGGVISLTACSSLPLSFSTEKIMKVRNGMSSKEILKMFGTPKSVRQAVCGANFGQSWTCTTWEYGGYPDKASFTFSGDNPETMVLNSFDVDRD